MEKHYNYKTTEQKWNKIWREQNTFHTEPDNRKPYSIVIPPPNVTDILHLGHALNNTFQDILIRYHRNIGYNAEWLPGTDHAGIATQVIVEKLLLNEGTSKEELGREEFLKRIWHYVNGRKDTILRQLESIGASCDWDRKRFTLDKQLSKTVAYVFKQLYEEGYIYKGRYIVNWCPRCHTAISDEEVEYRESDSKLYYIKYKVKNSDEFIVVATTRPETMLGDTAVAINPNDKSKIHLKDKTVILPLINREIPIVLDNHVDMEFGTGFVKVTPAHDANDFEIGNRHNLEQIIIMNTNAIINENGGKYRGLTREQAREKIIEDLKQLNQLESIEDYKNSIGRCYRCKTVIEPYLSEQWFVKMKELAKPALDASIDNSIRFFPSRWQGVYNHWLENIKDWCISRQLWWGHRIPVFYCNDCKNEFVDIDKPNNCPNCNSSNIYQDENVLDTWFSSWLWPFSTFGWPEENDDYKYFYPTNVIVSASEILFFWIARMIIAGIHFTGTLPFKDIYIHGTVRDAKGIKMSKSLGNGIDPREIVEEYGADALRFSLIFLSGQGKDPNIKKDSFEIGRNFANKIWNAVRFVLLKYNDKKTKEEDLFDKWILYELSKLEQRVEHSITKYRFADYTQSLYDFFWHEFCDWYIEIIKTNNKDMDTAIFVINRFIKMLNPIMPYISEEINALLNNDRMIHQQEYKRFVYEFDRNDMEIIRTLKSLVITIRNIIYETNIKTIYIKLDSNTKIKDYKDTIVSLSNAEHIEFIEEQLTNAIPFVFNAGIIFVKTDNREGLYEKYKNEYMFIKKQIEKLNNKLNNKRFMEKAPKHIIEETKEKRDAFNNKLSRIEKILNSLKI